MAAPRFRSRFVHATIVDATKTALDQLGWLNAPINFDTAPIRVLDYQPDERGEKVNVNTVAVTLGDVPADADEELGAAVGGLRSASYPIWCDIYMQEQALSVAVADDLRDTFSDLALQLEDKIHGGFVSGVIIHVEDIIGPERPPSANTNDTFKKFWRVLHFSAVLYFNT
jgi:hypothetical protein